MTTPWEEGDPTSKICLVGEAPAHQEMREGRPFVGWAGQVLDQLLHHAGVARRECYITNVFTHQIRDGSGFLDRHGRLTPAAAPEVQKLKERLEACQANVFVPLGAVASAALTEKGTGLLKWRGSPIPSTLLPGRKCIPTIHPAATLPGRGQYIWRYFIVHDLRKAKRHSEFPELPVDGRHILINPTFDEAVDYLRTVKTRATRTALDIEVSNHQVSCLALTLDSEDCISVPFKDLRGWHRWSPEQERDLWLLIAAIVEDPDITKLGQNLIFDLHFLLWKNRIIPRGPIQDTMIAHHIIYPDFPKGLDFLCSVYTDYPYYKDDGKIWKKEGATEDEILRFWRYNGRDAVNCYPIWDSIESILDRDGYRGSYDQTIALFRPLMFMQCRGLNVDKERLEVTKKEVSDRLEARKQALNSCIRPFTVDGKPYTDLNALSPKQCMAYFYANRGLKAYVNKDGRPTTDDKAMQRIYRKTGWPEAKLVQEIRSLNKLFGTYLDVTLDADGRLRCSFNPRGTTTGRLSSSQTIFETGLNLQNLHPEFKSFLIPDRD